VLVSRNVKRSFGLFGIWNNVELCPTPCTGGCGAGAVLGTQPGSGVMQVVRRAARELTVLLWHRKLELVRQLVLKTALDHPKNAVELNSGMS
jgi:hypothetical protein